MYCNSNKAKSILDKFNPKIHMLDQDFSREGFFEKFPDARSFPQIVKYKKNYIYFDVGGPPKKDFSSNYQSGPLSFEYFFEFLFFTKVDFKCFSICLTKCVTKCVTKCDSNRGTKCESKVRNKV